MNATLSAANATLNHPAHRVRMPAAAGRFYSADPVELRHSVEALLAGVKPVTGPVPKAIIAPHAGYAYSGPIAASAYARLAPAKSIIRRIVLIGPSHFVGFQGLAAPSVEAFATPLGEVPVDTAAVTRLASLPQVGVLDEAHGREHSLEVQLPFLQMVLENFSLVPLAAGEVDTDDISQVLDMLWGGPETRLVISSDLSHYYEAHVARGIDRATADAIEALTPEDINENQACGRMPVCGLLRAAQRHGLRAHTLDLRNSGDTAGPRTEVVGYGAFEFVES